MNVHSQLFNLARSTHMNVRRPFRVLLDIAISTALCASLIACDGKREDPGPGPSPLPVAKQLQIEPLFQSTTEWCWAASAEMVLRFYGLPNLNPAGNYQCGIIGLAGAIGVLPQICNIDCRLCVVPISTAAGYTAVIQQYPIAVRSFGFTARSITVENRFGPLSFQAVMASIDASVPIIAGVNPSGIPNSYGPEHAVVVIGYERTSTGLERLVVNDPFPYGFGPLGPFGDPYLQRGAQLTRLGQYAISYSVFAQSLVWNYTLIPR